MISEAINRHGLATNSRKDEKMKTYTVAEYEQSDFDAVKNGMTREEAIQILEHLPRGWFPYNLPKWGRNVSGADYDNYRVCCALKIAVEALKKEK